jgi:hypothetical protein
MYREDCEDARGLHGFTCLTLVGWVFSIACTYSGFGLMVCAVTWSSGLVPKVVGWFWSGWMVGWVVSMQDGGPRFGRLASVLVIPGTCTKDSVFAVAANLLFVCTCLMNLLSLLHRCWSRYSCQQLVRCT